MVKIVRNNDGSFSSNARPPAEGERPDIKRVPAGAGRPIARMPGPCEGNYSQGFPGEPNIGDYETWRSTNGFEDNAQTRRAYQTARAAGCAARRNLFRQYEMQQRKSCTENNFGIPCVKEIIDGEYWGSPHCNDCWAKFEFVPITCRSSADCAKRNGKGAGYSKCYVCNNPSTKNSSCSANEANADQFPCATPTPTPTPDWGAWCNQVKACDDNWYTISCGEGKYSNWPGHGSTLGFIAGASCNESPCPEFQQTPTCTDTPTPNEYLCWTRSGFNNTCVIAATCQQCAGTIYNSQEECIAACSGYTQFIPADNYYSFLIDRIDQTPTPIKS